MTWFIDEQKKLVAASEQRKKDYNESRVVLPGPGQRMTVGVRVNAPPLVKIVDGKKRPGTKFNVYQYDTPDGKVLECYSDLHEKIVAELNNVAGKIAADGSEFVYLDIMNGSTSAQKAAYFVIARAGV